MTSPLESTPTHTDGMLAQILLKLGEIGTQQAVMIEQLKAIPDHEQRLRKLEAWRYALPVAGLLTLASIVLAVASYLRR